MTTFTGPESWYSNNSTRPAAPTDGQLLGTFCRRATRRRSRPWCAGTARWCSASAGGCCATPRRRGRLPGDVPGAGPQGGSVGSASRWAAGCTGSPTARPWGRCRRPRRSSESRCATAPDRGHRGSTRPARSAPRTNSICCRRSTVRPSWRATWKGGTAQGAASPGPQRRDGFQPPGEGADAPGEAADSLRRDVVGQCARGRPVARGVGRRACGVGAFDGPGRGSPIRRADSARNARASPRATRRAAPLSDRGSRRRNIPTSRREPGKGRTLLSGTPSPRSYRNIFLGLRHIEPLEIGRAQELPVQAVAPRVVRAADDVVSARRPRRAASRGGGNVVKSAECPVLAPHDRRSADRPLSATTVSPAPRSCDV